MSEPIVSRAEIERRARADYRAGKQLADCPLPWHSDARADYERAFLAAGKGAPQLHAAPAGRGCVELAQVCA